jgi:hypothetical protein
MLRDMEAQKHLLPMTKGKQKGSMWIDGQVRLMPFGLVEYVFPRDDLDMVLSTFSYEQSFYGINFKYIPFALLRKFLKLKKQPKYTRQKKYLWRTLGVSVFVVGIREDDDLVGWCELDKGWFHEAI